MYFNINIDDQIHYFPWEKYQTSSTVCGRDKNLINFQRVFKSFLFHWKISGQTNWTKIREEKEKHETIAGKWKIKNRKK